MWPEDQITADGKDANECTRQVSIDVIAIYCPKCASEVSEDGNGFWICPCSGSETLQLMTRQCYSTPEAARKAQEAKQ